MKSTSLKIQHLLWKQVGLCVLGSGCAAKEIGRRDPWQEKEKCTKLFKFAFESLQIPCEFNVPALFCSGMYLSNDRVKMQ